MEACLGGREGGNLLLANGGGMSSCGMGMAALSMAWREEEGGGDSRNLLET